MGRRIEVTQPDGSTEVHEGDETLDTPDEGEEVAAAQGASDTPDPSPQADAPAAAAPDEPDEVTVSIGDEAPADAEPEQAPEWVRELRKSHRELQRKVKEYEDRERTAPPAAVQKALGPKPKLEDHDYDTDRYETALEAWYKQREEQAQAEAKQRSAAEEAERAWKAKLDGYGKAKADLKVRDFEEAEATVLESLNTTQQGVVLQGADNPALVVYALGKNPKRAKEIASISDPVRFAFAVAKLEAQLKVTPRSKPPAPERTVPVGTAPVSGASDSTLERLREEAARTGDMTKVVRYKQQLKAKAQARA